jgi:DNA-binding response OmpR family regulator
VFLHGDVHHVEEVEMVAQPHGPSADESSLRCGLRVLIVEDDDTFAEYVAKIFTARGDHPTRVSHGDDATVRHRDADVVLLDLMLPEDRKGLYGLRVLHGLRKVTDKPVLVVTGQGDARTTVCALRRGADDYIVKPFRSEVLLARVDAVFRRYKLSEQSTPRTVTVRDMVIDFAARRVTVAGAAVALTKTEFDLLAVLARTRGTAVSREQLLYEVTGDASPSRSQSLGVHMTALRQKLTRPGLIVTLHGFGYRLDG